MDFKHYWLCYDCALARGGTWPEGHACTTTRDTCPYCKEEKTVIPYVDFDWPGKDFKRARD